MGRTWVRFDVGLLADERLNELTFEERGWWLTAYLLIAREGDSVKSVRRLEYLLSREGVADAAAAVDRLRGSGWIVRHSTGGYTIRGYEKYQLKYMRGPSDDPLEKAKRNASRPKTRNMRKRGASVERVWSEVERHRTGQYKTPPNPHGGATEGVAPSGGRSDDGKREIGALKEQLKRHGYEPK